MRRLKLLTGLSTVAFTGALALGACGGDGEGEGANTRSAPADQSGEGEGEGQGSEAEGEGAKSAVADKAAYLSQLMILRGHLKAGALLYAAGESGLAAAHMKHPHDELYVTLKPAMEAFGATGLDAELTGMSAAVEGGMPADAVDGAFRSVEAAARRAEAAAAPAIKDKLLASALTLRQAGVEFDEGVKDGAIVNAKEYQDAYGFIVAVVEMLGTVEGANPAEKDAVELARDQAALALGATPGVLPSAPLAGLSSAVYSAAARIEIAALGLE